MTEQLNRLEMLIVGLEKRMERRTWLNASQLSDYLNISTKKIYELCRAGKIPQKKIDNQYTFNRKQIDIWLLTGSTTPGKLERQRANDYLE